MPLRRANLPPACLILFMLLFQGCTPVHEEDPGYVRPVKIIQVKKPEEPQFRIFPGKVRPVKETRLSFRVSNQLERLSVDKGDFVLQGDIVAVLDPRDFELAVKNLEGSLMEAEASLKAMRAGARTEDVVALEARLRAARSALEESMLKYTRFKNLFQQGAVAEAELDQVRTALEEAQSRVRGLEMEMQKALTGAREEDIQAMEARISSLQAGLEEALSAREDAVLRAPFSGYVAETYVDDHENVSAGQPIARLQDLSRLEVIFGLPEQVVIHRDRITDIYCLLDAYPGFPLPARIREIATDASDKTFSYAAAALLEVPEELAVVSSMAARVHLGLVDSEDRPEQGVVLVPETAVFSRDRKKSLVWVYDSETFTVSSRQISTGALTSAGVQVVSGLEYGEFIVAAGAQFLEEGQKVRPIEKGP